MQKTIPRLASEVHDASVKLAEKRAELAGCEIDIDFAFDDATLAAFAALVRAYENLRGCEAIWDITHSIATNRGVQRTIAANLVNRTPVRLGFGSSEIINSKYQALVLGNVNGEDIYIYPGFVMMRSPGQNFALIDVRDLAVELTLSQFVEEGQVPQDSEVIDHTWTKTNKDGSPDRRFRDNYQIPVVQYGQLLFRSPTGLQEAYLVSNFGRTKAFAAAFGEYQMALETLAKRSEQSAPTDLGETLPPAAEEEVAHSVTDDASLEPPPAHVVNPTPKNLFLDWATLIVIALLLMLGTYAVMNRITSGSGSPVAAGAPSGPPAAISAPAKATAQSAAQATSEIVFVQKNGANVRAGPSTSASIVRTEPRGKQLTVFQRVGQWVQIGEATPFGWIHADLLGVKAPE